jgi:hypothetical protein
MRFENQAIGHDEGFINIIRLVTIFLLAGISANTIFISQVKNIR